MMSREKENIKSKLKKCRVRFKTDSNTSFSLSKTNLRENDKQECDKPTEEERLPDKETCTGSSANMSDLSSRHSIESTSRPSRESLETDFNPDKMSGDEQSAYHVVRSALKYGYANHIINKNDRVFWLRKFPAIESSDGKTVRKLKKHDEYKFRKRKRPRKQKSTNKSTQRHITKKPDTSTDSSSESILSSPYKICKIKCVSKK
ncbi:uncharacterized protein LOC123670967 [Harmonia axyridis]|uniref:uncharacterized protein LOC123670967 n=1 Tax=Harmonia axyridis TaxID=115357 RepID=UPI001E275037|nr:uncharacterized protein LOC123670967 [Harmonia axyridis]